MKLLFDKLFQALHNHTSFRGHRRVWKSNSTYQYIYGIAVCNLFVQECHKPPVTEQDVNDPRFVWYCNKCSKNMKKMVRTAQSCNLVISSLRRVTEDFSYICNCPMLFLPVHYSGGICAAVYVPELLHNFFRGGGGGGA